MKFTEVIIERHGLADAWARFKRQFLTGDES
jgi:hypothetical protein